MLDINKQAMKYALQGQTVTVYEKDEDGNLKFYETEDGEKIYYTHEETGFSEPIDFRANISFDGGEAQNKEYGFNTADFDAVLLTDRGEYPLSTTVEIILYYLTVTKDICADLSTTVEIILYYLTV